MTTPLAPMKKLCAGGGEREKGGHVLRDTTSRGLYVRVWPPRTSASERRGGGGGCEQEGWFWSLENLLSSRSR